MYINRIPFAIGALTCAMLSACGGGGGGGGTSAAGTGTPQAPAPSETEIAITNDNTTQVASLGHLIVGNGLSLSMLTGETLVGAEVSTSQGARVPSLVELTFSAIDRALRRPSRTSASTTPVGAFTDSETVNCSDSGSYTISGEAAHPINISPGDKSSIRYNNCVEQGVNITGTINIVISEASGLFESEQAIKATTTISNLRYSYESVSTSMNGTVQAYRKASSLSRGNGWVRSDGFTYDIQRGEVKSVLKSTGLEVTFKDDSFQTIYTITQTASANFPKLKGRFAVTTAVPLVQNSNGFIERGAVNLAGTNSKLKLSYLQPSSNSTPLVQYQPDTNNDDNYEMQTTTTYAALTDSLW